MDQATPNAWLGVDVAKEKVDCVLLVGSRSRYHVFANPPAGFEQIRDRRRCVLSQSRDWLSTHLRRTN